MKISAKALLVGIYVLISVLAAVALQSNPQFLAKIDDFIQVIQDFGVAGMFLYTFTSATVMALAIPLQFIDLIVGIIYPLKEAILILIGSKMLGAAMTYYIANHLMSADTRNFYSSYKYLQGLHDLVKKQPLKYGLLIRFSSIPIVIRNYGLAVLPIDFQRYMICVFLQSSVTSPMQAYTGSHFTSFMEYANAAPPQPVLDEQGNIIEVPQPQTSDTKIFGVLVVILSIACSLFVGYRIKKKVDEINRQAESKKEK